MESQKRTTSPETLMKQIFCTIEKEKCNDIRPPIPVSLLPRIPMPTPTQEQIQIKREYIKKIIIAVKLSDLDTFIALLTPDTVYYAYLYEYEEIPLIEYLFIQYQKSETSIRKRILLKMALHLSTLIDKRDSNNFYDALGYSQKEVEEVCQE